MAQEPTGEEPGKDFIIRSGDGEADATLEQESNGGRFLDWAVELAREAETSTDRGHTLAHIVEHAGEYIDRDKKLTLLDEALEDFKVSDITSEVAKTEEELIARLCGQRTLTLQYAELGEGEKAIQVVELFEEDAPPNAIAALLGSEELPEAVGQMNEMQESRLYDLERIRQMASDLPVFAKGGTYAFIAEKTGYSKAFRRAKRELDSISEKNPCRAVLSHRLAEAYFVQGYIDSSFELAEQLPDAFPLKGDIALKLAGAAARERRDGDVLRAAALVRNKEQRAQFLAALVAETHKKSSTD